MLNCVPKKERVKRTLNGIRSQIDDFFFIIEDYVNTLNEKELQGLYELKEDIN